MAKSAKKPTDAERLAADCIHCGAMPGHPCRDYLGRVAPFCLERGKPDVTRRKLEKKAAEDNARKLKQFGGDNTLLTYLHDGADNLLAAEGVEKVTADQLATQRWHAHAFKESTGHAETVLKEAFNWITLREIRRFTAALIGAEWEAKVWAYCERAYRDNKSGDYHHTTYCGVLTRGDRLVLEREMRFDPARANKTFPDGRHFVETCVWPPEGYRPPLTWPEFRDRFPWHHMSVRPAEDLREPDDGGLFERTIGALARVAA